MSDFVSFAELHERFYNNQIKLLQELSLRSDKRLCFYTLGFAEGLILDEVNQKWRDAYQQNRFDIWKEEQED